MKRTFLSLLASVLLLFTGCQPEVIIDYDYMTGLWDVVEAADGIYIGKVTDMASELHEKAPSPHEPQYKEKFIAVTVTVGEVLDGTCVPGETRVEDIPANFQQDITVGDEYLILSNCYDEENANAYFRGNPYWIMHHDNGELDVPAYDRLVAEGHYKTRDTKPTSVDAVRDVIRRVADRVIATVNGEVLLQSQVDGIRIYRQISTLTEPDDLTDEELLQELIRNTVTLQYAKENGLAISEAEMKDKAERQLVQMNISDYRKVNRLTEVACLEAIVAENTYAQGRSQLRIILRREQPETIKDPEAVEAYIDQLVAKADIVYK